MVVLVIGAWARRKANKTRAIAKAAILGREAMKEQK